MANQYPITTISANGTTTVNVPEGKYVIHVAGTWGSGTLSIKWYDGTTAVEFPSGSLTANGLLEVSNGTGIIQFVLSGATNPSLKVSYGRI